MFKATIVPHIADQISETQLLRYMAADLTVSQIETIYMKWNFVRAKRFLERFRKRRWRKSLGFYCDNCKRRIRPKTVLYGENYCKLCKPKKEVCDCGRSELEVNEILCELCLKGK